MFYPELFRLTGLLVSVGLDLKLGEVNGRWKSRQVLSSIQVRFHSSNVHSVQHPAILHKYCPQLKS